MVASPASAGQVLLEQQPQSQQPRALSEKPNPENALRRPRAREITSRYKSTPSPPPIAATPPPTPSSSSSSSSARRFPSPIIGRSFSGPDSAKRASSAERRRSDSPAGKSSTSTGSSSRPGTPRSSTTSLSETLRGSSTQRLWPSSNLSTSLQLDHTLKPAENGIRRGPAPPPDNNSNSNSNTSACSNRKGTPERKRTPVRRPLDQAENAKPLDNPQRWPGNSPKSLSRSMDLTSTTTTTTSSNKPGSLTGLMVQGRALNGSTRAVRRTPPIRSLSRSINEGPLPDSPQSVSRHMISESRGREEETESTVSEGQPSSLDNISDTESLSSATSAGSGRKAAAARPGGNRLSLTDHDFSSSASSLVKGGRRLRSLSLSGGSPAPSTPGLSPGRMSSGAASSQPPSPSRSMISSPFRSMASPTRSRVPAFQLPPSGFNSRASLSSLLHLPDLRKGKKAMSQQEEAQYLRILHNRWLQWCFVNARAEAARTCQKAIAERSIYNAWLQTSELRKSVAMKRIKLQQARQVRKLHSILSSQGPQLENWAGLQQEHSVALSGAMEALEAAVLRVPVTAGARGDVQAIRDALVCAVDVMGSVESSVASLLPKTVKMDALVCELAEVAKQEKSLLEECNGLLDRIAALEIEERSLRTHFVQLECEKSRDWIPTTTTTTTTTPAKTC